MRRAIRLFGQTELTRRRTTMGDSRRVAVCITGLQRSLLELPVVTTYERHVLKPLSQTGFAAESFFAVVVPPDRDGTHERLTAAIHSSFVARSVSLVPLAETEALLHEPHCNLRVNATWANPRGDVSVLLQWHAIGRCFADVVAAERTSGSYEWMLRVRTDLVYFADVPLVGRALNAEHVYVSSSGMTDDTLYRCMNDQIVICPRRLCRPYFALLELWTSPHCNAVPAPLDAPTTIFAPSATEPHGAVSGPSSPFTLPLPPAEKRRTHMSAQWYMFARYSTRGGTPCKPAETTEACCGLLREVAWPYSIARGRSSLECQFRLAEYPSRRPTDADFRRRPHFDAERPALLARCRQLQGEWRRSHRSSRAKVAPRAPVAASPPTPTLDGGHEHEHGMGHAMGHAMGAPPPPAPPLPPRLSSRLSSSGAAAGATRPRQRGKDGTTGVTKTTTRTTTGPDSICNATLIKQTSRYAMCVANETFGCRDHQTVYLAKGCAGKFTCGRSGMLCETVTEWALLGTAWWRDYPDASHAPHGSPPAMILGAMMNLSTSPYTTNGAVRSVGRRETAYTPERVLEAVRRFMRAAATRRLANDGELSIHVVHDLPRGALAAAALAHTRRSTTRRTHRPEDSAEVILGGDDAVATYMGVHLHRLESPVRASGGGGMTVPAHDARWEAYLRVIDKLRAHAPSRAAPTARAARSSLLDERSELPLPTAATPADVTDGTTCAFSVDFSDVRVLNDLRALCVAQPPTALFASSDLCHADPPARLLMLKQIRETGFTSSEELHSLLHPPRRTTHDANLPMVLHNVGIFGGRLGVFERALRELAARTRAHYDASDHDGIGRRSASGLPPAGMMPRHVLDMVIFHELALHHDGPIVRGWPHGPLNLPFWGENCLAAAYFCRQLGETNRERANAVAVLRKAVLGHSLANGFVPAINRTAERPRCDMGDFLSAMSARHYFAHKVGCGHTIRC